MPGVRLHLKLAITQRKSQWCFLRIFHSWPSIWSALCSPLCPAALCSPLCHAAGFPLPSLKLFLPTVTWGKRAQWHQSGSVGSSGLLQGPENRTTWPEPFQTVKMLICCFLYLQADTLHFFLTCRLSPKFRFWFSLLPNLWNIQRQQPEPRSPYRVNYFVPILLLIISCNFLFMSDLCCCHLLCRICVSVTLSTSILHNLREVKESGFLFLYFYVAVPASVQ